MARLPTAIGSWLTALVVVCTGGRLLAQTSPSDVRVEVVVTVTDEQTPTGYVYRYRVENRSSFAIGSLFLGFNRITGETEFEIDPILIRAPSGWTGSAESDEGPYCVVWEQVDPADTVHEIAPGGILDGFEVILPRPAPEFSRATFTAFMSDAVYDVGNVKPAPGTPLDRRPPIVALTSPSAGTTLSGMVPVSVDAADETGIADVRFLLDGEDMSRRLVNAHLDTAPYSATWSTYGIPNGTHTLAAVARDIAGNRTTSAGVTVTLQNDETPLAISMTSPTSGGSVSGATALSASVTSGSRVLGVRFRVDGANVGEWVTTTPYSTSWDSGTVSNGSHSVTATAMNEGGEVQQTPPLTVVVANGGGSASITHTEPAKLWLGLKNSDDQGTSFDFRVALYARGVLVASGETLCVTGLTRNATQAREVSVALGAISSHSLSPGDVVALQVSTRIGMNPDGSRCAGHSNAVGVRLYYDTTNRPSRFGATVVPDSLRSFFLRANGASLVLDPAAPSATSARQRDSPSVSFAGGNPWKEIGTWSRSVP